MRVSVGFRRFVARKKSRCKLIGNRFVIPHDTIPSTVVHHIFKDIVQKKKFYDLNNYVANWTWNFYIFTE